VDTHTVRTLLTQMCGRVPCSQMTHDHP
jgi:hypothetical protein